MTNLPDINDALAFGSYVVSNDAPILAERQATAAEELTRAETAKDAAANAHAKLQGGISQMRADSEDLGTKLTPAARESEVLAALMESSEDRATRSARLIALAQQKAWIDEVRAYGIQKVEPKVLLDSVRAEAEAATSVAALAVCDAALAARESYEAGAQLRAVEGTAPLYPDGGRAAQLVARARKLAGEANSIWVNFHNREQMMRKQA